MTNVEKKAADAAEAFVTHVHQAWQALKVMAQHALFASLPRKPCANCGCDPVKGFAEERGEEKAAAPKTPETDSAPVAAAPEAPEKNPPEGEKEESTPEGEEEDGEDSTDEDEGEESASTGESPAPSEVKTGTVTPPAKTSGEA